MLTACLEAHGMPAGSATAAAPTTTPAAAVRSGPWRLIKLGPGANGEMAPAEAHKWGSRQLLEWAKSREAQEAGLGLDQVALEQFVRRVVTLFTQAYAHTTLKHGRLVEGGRVSKPLPQSCALLRAVDARFPRSLDIFDFSERHALRRAAEVRHVRNVLDVDIYTAGEVKADVSCRWSSVCAAGRSAPHRCWCCQWEMRFRSPSGACANPPSVKTAPQARVTHALSKHCMRCGAGQKGSASIGACTTRSTPFGLAASGATPNTTHVARRPSTCYVCDRGCTRARLSKCMVRIGRCCEATAPITPKGTRQSPLMNTRQTLRHGTIRFLRSIFVYI